MTGSEWECGHEKASESSRSGVPQMARSGQEFGLGMVQLIDQLTPDCLAPTAPTSCAGVARR
jgi:hypothetical protein